MKKPKKRGFAIVCAALLVAGAGVMAGCSDDDPTGPTSGSVTVNFDHRVGGVPLQFGAVDYTNAAGNNYSVERLVYYVSDIRLHNVIGTTYGVDDVHFRDGNDPATRSYQVGGVPNGTYNAVSFIFGLDAKDNVNGGLPIDTPTAGMVWPDCWGGGYHYMILEGKYKESVTDSLRGYRTHTGRRKLIQGGGCQTSGIGGPDDVNHHHFFEVVLPLSSFGINGTSRELTVIMNINGWYENPVLDLETLFPKGQGGIMTNLTVQQQLKENGPGCFTVSVP